MNYLFVQTRSEHPQVYLAVASDYSDAQKKAESFAQLHEFYLHIFVVEPNSHQPVTGMPALLLRKEGWVGPKSSRVQHYVNLAASESDNLPQTQAVAELTQAIDYLEKRCQQLEARLESNTTGPCVASQNEV